MSKAALAFCDAGVMRERVARIHAPILRLGGTPEAMRDARYHVARIAWLTGMTQEEVLAQAIADLDAESDGK